MAVRHRVVGPLAVAIVGGKRVYLPKDTYVPKGADPERLAHLIDLGLVAVVDDGRAEPEPEPVPAAPEPAATLHEGHEPGTDPENCVTCASEPVPQPAEPSQDAPVAPSEDPAVDGMNLSELRELAKKRGIALNGARSKDEITAAIKAALA